MAGASPARGGRIAALAIAGLVLAMGVPAAPQAPPADAPPPAAPPAKPPSGWFGRSAPLMIPPFVGEFPGLDLSRLTAAARERFIHRANTELCPSGKPSCTGHTIAMCYTMDAGACRPAKTLLEKILAELTPASAKPAPPVPQKTPAQPKGK